MPGRAVLILAAFVLSLATAFGSGWWVNGNRWEAKYTQAELRHSKEREAQADAAIYAFNTYRAKEQEWAATRARMEAERHAERKALQARIASLAAAGDGLRNDLRQAAAECGAASGDPIAACREYAAALGALLADFRAAGLQVAEAAEEHAADVRRLLAEWPQ
jgi:hypothetical protein